jgi:hypothetical protein
MNVRNTVAVTLVGLLAACGSSSTSNTARMNVRLVDSPAASFTNVFLTIQDVQIQTDSGWKVLGTVNKTIDLLALQNGAFETLALNAEIDPGHYGQMRLTLSTAQDAIQKVCFNNNVLPNLTGCEDLTIPSGFQTGIKIPVSFDLQAGTTYEIFIDMNATKSVFVHQAGGSGKYMLRPVVHAYDKLMTGSIKGRLTGDGGTPLNKVEVIAQTVSGGVPTFANSAVTDADGNYSIGLLPVDATYYVACQPVTFPDTTSYLPKASPAIAVTTAAPIQVWTADFTSTPDWGGLAGSVTSSRDTDTQKVDVSGSVVQVRFPFDLGGTLVNVPLIVRHEATNYDATLSPPVTYAIDRLPVSSLYTLVAELPANASTNPAPLFSTPTPAPVTKGTTSTVNLVLP